MGLSSHTNQLITSPNVSASVEVALLFSPTPRVDGGRGRPLWRVNKRPEMAGAAGQPHGQSPSSHKSTHACLRRSCRIWDTPVALRLSWGNLPVAGRQHKAVHTQRKHGLAASLLAHQWSRHYPFCITTAKERTSQSVLPPSHLCQEQMS